MIWALVGVAIAVLSSVWWLRRPVPDGATGAAASTASPSATGTPARRPLNPVRPHPVQSVRRDPPPQRPPPQRRRRSPYSAVSIKTGVGACSAALELGNLRFLEDAAPVLPLQRCDRAVCHCSIHHFADRRRGEASDRREGIGLKSELYGSAGEPERRRRHGRRASDHR